MYELMERIKSDEVKQQQKTYPFVRIHMLRHPTHTRHMSQHEVIRLGIFRRDLMVEAIASSK